jgi:hypothetical protein
MRQLRSFGAVFRHRQQIRIRRRDQPRASLLLASLFGGAYLLAAPSAGLAFVAGVITLIQASLSTLELYSVDNF